MGGTDLIRAAPINILNSALYFRKLLHVLRWGEHLLAGANVGSSGWFSASAQTAASCGSVYSPRVNAIIGGHFPCQRSGSCGQMDLAGAAGPGLRYRSQEQVDQARGEK